ncbi:MAG: Ig-like domain-containing protein, partial [Gemmatimonadaceae bacterium]|nr:Ig-like domain-containing protein [Gemmatimonadaceae bacterium]
MSTRSPFLLSAALLAVLGACSDSNPVGTAPPVPTASPVARVEVIAPISALEVNLTSTVYATVTAENGSRVVNRPVEWVSSNNNIATVTSTGNLTARVAAVGVGTVVISAKLDGKAGSVSLITSSRPAPLPQQGFLWSEADGFTIIAPLPGATASFPTGINSAGTVVGIGNANGTTRPFIWTRARGTSLDLELLPGSTSCYANAINDAEQVVGTCYSQSSSRAFRWSAAAGMTEVGVPAGAVGSTATSINSAGEIGGASDVSSGSTVVTKPGRWNSAGVFESLKLPGLTTYGAVTGIDDAGNAVGYASDGDDYSYSPV